MLHPRMLLSVRHISEAPIKTRCTHRYINKRSHNGPYKALGRDSKGIVGLTRPLKGLLEAFQKALKDSFSGWQEKRYVWFM